MFLKQNLKRLRNNKISPTVYALYTVNLINYLRFTGTMYATIGR